MSKEIDKIFEPKSRNSLAVNNLLVDRDRILFQLMHLSEDNRVIRSSSYFMYNFNAMSIALECLSDPDSILSNSSENVGHIIFDKLKTTKGDKRKLQIRISQPDKITVLIDENSQRLYLNMDISRFRVLILKLLLACSSHDLSKHFSQLIQDEFSKIRTEFDEMISSKLSQLDCYIDHPF